MKGNRREPPLSTIPRFARLIKRPEAAVRRGVKAGEIPHVIVGGQILIATSYAAKLLQQAGGDPTEIGSSKTNE